LYTHLCNAATWKTKNLTNFPYDINRTAAKLTLTVLFQFICILSCDQQTFRLAQPLKNTGSSEAILFALMLNQPTGKWLITMIGK
jgi:hypothetical protein